MQRHFHLSVLEQLAVTLVGVDLVLFQQTRDAARQRLDDLVLALLHLGHVHRGVLHLDPVSGKQMLQIVVVVGRVQQRFRRDAADVEAGAAQRGFAVRAEPLIHAGGLEAELSAADRRDVSAGPRADDDNIVFLHWISLLTALISDM